jgi:muramoyltetrapeptide carboxypeptidase
MNKIIVPSKLKLGDEIRVIAPSCSGKTIKKEKLKEAKSLLEGLGFKVTYGKNVFELNEFQSSSLESRLQDLHDAFRDKNVQGILAVRGGFNINDLLDYVDWDLIRKNPKVYCGYSDNTALQNAIFTKTGLTTYSGPNFSTFGNPKQRSYSLNNFLNAVVTTSSLDVKNYSKTEVITGGKATGQIIGGNLCTLNLLQGTQYMPDIRNKILFIEDDYVSELDPLEFHRNFQSLISLPGFDKVRGIVFGKFQPESKIPVSYLRKIVKLKRELKGVPVIANLNFGHTLPLFTFPIGGVASIDTAKAMPLAIKF